MTDTASLPTPAAIEPSDLLARFADDVHALARLDVIAGGFEGRGDSETGDTIRVEVWSDIARIERHLENNVPGGSWRDVECLRSAYQAVRPARSQPATPAPATARIPLPMPTPS